MAAPTKPALTRYPSNQILRHEVGHDMVAKGEIDIAKVRQKIKDTFKTDKEVDQIAEYYATAYAMSTSTAEDVEAIWEEVICDSLADMNVFSGSKMWAEAAEHMGMTIPAVQKAVSEGKANQTRGSPDSNVTKQLAEDLADFIPKHLGLRNIGNKSKAEIVDRYIKNLEDDYSRKTMVKSIQESIKGRWDGFKLTSPELISQAEGFIERIESLDKTISGKASRELWYPQLTQNEWNLLNYRLKRELYSEENFIDSSTKWLYAESKGTKVFAIYGIGDGTEATVLYAVGGKTAETLNNRRVEYEQNINRTERNPYKKSLDRIGVQQYKYGDSTNRNGQNVPTTNRGVGPVSTGQQRGYNGGTVSTNSKQVKYSRELTEDKSYAPTFYSQMAKVVDDVKQDKLGANSVVNMLRGKGVKAEEIKWSGIEAFLEGKKSVAKAELQEFIAGSQLEIEELEDDRWEDYSLEGGTNYRDIIFKMPNSSYSNNAMRGHWGGDAKGILAHARIQDFEVDGKKMLFVEEIQSDWHNEGAKEGYKTKLTPQQLKKVEELRKKQEILVEQMRDKLSDDDVEAALEIFEEEKKVYQERLDIEGNQNGIPDAPFKDNYHEYVLKRLIRMAAEEGYDSIGWTTADIQSQRWSDQYAEGYRIEYDQDIPSFLKKYGKKWGATVEKVKHPSLNTTITFFDKNRDVEYDTLGEWRDVVFTDLKEQGANIRNAVFDDQTNEVIVYDRVTGMEYDRAEKRKHEGLVWSMPITDSMKQSVLYEGQPRFSRELDTAYLDAVKSGDMETAQDMVDEAAKKAG